MKQSEKTRLSNISAARAKYAGWVIVHHAHQVGGQLRDRKWWCAEKDGAVLDYHLKDVLVQDALRHGERVVVLRRHRDGQVTAKEDAVMNRGVAMPTTDNCMREWREALAQLERWREREQETARLIRRMNEERAIKKKARKGRWGSGQKRFSSMQVKKHLLD